MSNASTNEGMNFRGATLALPVSERSASLESLVAEKKKKPAVQADALSRSSSASSCSTCTAETVTLPSSESPRRDHVQTLRLVVGEDVEVLAGEWFALSTFDKKAAKPFRKKFMTIFEDFLNHSIGSWAVRLVVPNEGECTHFDRALRSAPVSYKTGCSAGEMLSMPIKSMVSAAVEISQTSSPLTEQWTSDGQRWGLHCNVYYGDKQKQSVTWAAAVVRPDNTIATFAVTARMCLGTVSCHTDAGVVSQFDIVPFRKGSDRANALQDHFGTQVQPCTPRLQSLYPSKSLCMKSLGLSLNADDDCSGSTTHRGSDEAESNMEVEEDENITCGSLRASSSDSEVSSEWDVGPGWFEDGDMTPPCKRRHGQNPCIKRISVEVETSA